MLLVLHILAALSGLASSTAAFIAPSRTKIYTTFGMIGLTLLSGTVLVIRTHAPVLHSCLTGLIYTAIVSAGAIAAQRRLAHQSEEDSGN